jgi:hypothetical protein
MVDDDDDHTGNLLIHPPELCANPTSNYLAASRRNV